MLELLEELPDPFKKAFNKVVKETELTMISVMIKYTHHNFIKKF